MFETNLSLPRTIIKTARYCLMLLGLLLPYSSAVSAKHLLIFGDSLSAAYNMPVERGWVSMLSQHWNGDDSSETRLHQVTNASISGETTQGGLLRLQTTLEQTAPDIVLLELGANDALRGVAVANVQRNLESMVALIIDSGADVILGSISVPMSYGPRYVDQFRTMYQEVAEKLNIPLIDLYIKDVAYNPDLLMEDGLHPNQAAQPVIFRHVLEKLTNTGFFDAD